MNILLINSDSPPLGGAEYHVELLQQLLQSKGHHCCTFFFNDYNANQIQAKLEALCRHNSFDIVHAHNVEYRYALYIKYLNSLGIPIVQTLHDYRYLCPACNLLKGSKICKDCFNGGYYKVFKCKYGLTLLNFAKTFFKKINQKSQPNILRADSNDNSTGNIGFVGNSLIDRLINSLKRHYSFIASVLHRFFCETIFHQDPLGIQLISKFIAPSNSLKHTFEEASVKFSNKIVHIDNFLPLDKFNNVYPVESEKPYILFAARLSREKGLSTLLDAVKDTGIPLVILGTGPLESYIRDRINTESGLSNVSLKGFKQGEELLSLIGRAKFCLVPSECYEVWGFSAVEPLALGRPTLVSKIGGLVEVVPNRAGESFEPGCVLELRNKIISMFNLPESTLSQMGAIGRKHVFENYSQEHYYQSLMKVYNQCLN